MKPLKILDVSPQLPYPLTDGGRRGVFYPLKFLSAKGHDIHMACLTEAADPGSVRQLEKFFRVECVTHSKRPKISRAALSLFSAVPYEISRCHGQELMARILGLLERHTFDIVQIEGIHAAYYGLEVKKRTGIPAVLRAHNVHWMNLQRLGPQMRNPFLRAYIAWEARKVRSYELSTSELFDRTLVVSKRDSEVLRDGNPEIRCEVVSGGVDLSEFAPSGITEDPCSVLWMGALGWMPNQDSFWWFYREIVPLIIRQVPEVVFHVVGSNPPPEILALRHPNVKVIGFVEDPREYIGRSQVCVVPLKVGSGVRLKLLEMFAMKKAAVSTSIGCEGLNVSDGQELLVADTPTAFADAVVRLLRDRTLREHLGQKAFDRVRRYFSWETVAAQFESTYYSLLGRK